jgi:hypothetical protein
MVIIATLLFATTVSEKPAQAFEVLQPSVAVSANGKNPALSTPTSRSVADSCLPLLKTVRQESPLSAMDRYRSANPASQAAALSLALGVRFALGPKETLKHGHRPRASIGLNVIPSGNGHAPQALAVAEYRRCKNETALRAMSEEWRWQR